MADAAQVYKPAKMAQATWDYLLKFTTFHEGVVNHMYHNYPSGSKYPDVSCGIGFLLPGSAADGKNSPTQATINDWLSFFKNPDSTPATADQFKEDWEKSYAVKRVTPGPKNGVLAEFSAVCKLVVKSELVRPKMASLLVKKLNFELGSSSLQGVDYWALPATAQVGIASLAFGYSLTKMPNFCQALKNGDLYKAASESKLSNMSDIKSYDHRLLFLDADYVQKYTPDDTAAMGYLPLTVSKWTPIYNTSAAVGSGGKSEQIMSE